MAEPKPFASLTSGLLARKGAASPAMRRQIMMGSGNAAPAFDNTAFDHATFDQMPQDDLGWNDMGEDSLHQSDPLALVALTPMGQPSQAAASVSPIALEIDVAQDAPLPAVLEQQRDLEDQFENSAEVVDTVPETVLETPVGTGASSVHPASSPNGAVSRGQRAKAAFTLRLDPDRHLRLRLACAVNHRSAQQIVTDALDAFLDSQPQITALAEQLPPPRGARY